VFNAFGISFYRVKKSTRKKSTRSHTFWVWIISIIGVCELLFLYLISCGIGKWLKIKLIFQTDYLSHL